MTNYCANCGTELIKPFEHHLYCTACLVSFVAEKQQMEPESQGIIQTIKQKWHRTTAPWRRK